MLLGLLALLHAAEAVEFGKTTAALQAASRLCTGFNLLPGSFIPLQIQAFLDLLEVPISAWWLSRAVQAGHSSRSVSTAAATTMTVINRRYGTHNRNNYKMDVP